MSSDHANAQVLAAGLSKIKGIIVDLPRVQTNIILYDVSGLGVDGKIWVAELNKRGVKAGAQELGRVRMVTHRGIEKEDIECALEAAEEAAKEIRSRR